MKNKEYVQQFLAGLNEEQKEAFVQASQMNVMQFYLMPGNEVQRLHRIFMGLINKNRVSYIKSINETQEAMAAETEHVHDESCGHGEQIVLEAPESE